MADPHELLAKYPVIVRQTVVWGDMDAYEHVNNVVYFRYFENARLAYFERMGWPAVEEETGVGPILAATTARFRRALTYPDTIAIAARAVNVEADRFTLEHLIVSEAQKAVVTEGTGLVVAYQHGEKRKAILPDVLRHRIAEVEAIRGDGSA
jgi:acyl-CoA thioester hydrolase